MINDVGFRNQTNQTGTLLTTHRRLNTENVIHLKFVDDLTLAEAINLPTQLSRRPELFLPMQNSRVHSQLSDVSKYAEENDMRINYKKTKTILFNPCKSMNFDVNFTINGHQLESVQEIRLLGVICRSDLRWSSNTRHIVNKANKRLWIIRRLKNLGTPVLNLVEVYVAQVRSLLELAVPVWHSSLTLDEKSDIERVQRSACYIILGHNYESYSKALELLSLEDLESRRVKLSLNFALKAEKSSKFKNWFIPNVKKTNTRYKNSKYCEVWANHDRLTKSPISHLINLLNNYYA